MPAAPPVRTAQHGLRGFATIVLYLLIAAGGLVASFTLYEHLLENTRQYYAYASMSRDAALDPTRMANCDMVTYIRVMSGQGGAGDVRVNACDIVMYSGGVAVVGFLSFLLVYLAFVVASLTVVALAPRPMKKATLLACSIGFLLLALPLRPAFWILELVVALCAVWLAPASGRTRAVIMVAATAAFFVSAGPPLVQACYDEFFSLSRLHVSSPGLEAALPVLNPALERFHLGQVNGTRGHDDGFPVYFLALALLLKTFRRVVRFAHELATNPARVDETSVADFFLYFVGLPSLLGEAVAPSFLGFVHSEERGPDRISGARTLAACFGLCSLAWCALLMMGNSPAVRVLFPHCDLATAPPHVVWAKLLTVLVIQYLFLLCTAEASVGVARLFGYGLHSNFDAPLQSVDPPDFWRRWNTHWREFLMTCLYYPTLLGLVRRNGGVQRGKHVVCATLVTFLGAFLFVMVPLVLMTTSSTREQSNLDTRNPSMLMRDSRSEVTTRDAQSSLQWQGLMPSLALYYLLDGLAVAWFLARRLGRREAPPSGWRRAACIVATLLFVALLRCLLDGSLPLSGQAQTMARSLGMGR